MKSETWGDVVYGWSLTKNTLVIRLPNGYKSKQSNIIFYFTYLSNPIEVLGHHEFLQHKLSLVFSPNLGLMIIFHCNRDDFLCVNILSSIVWIEIG